MDFWQSPEQLGKINQYLQLALVVFGVITAALGAASFVVSNRKTAIEAQQHTEFKQEVQTLNKRTAEIRELPGRHLSTEQKEILTSALAGSQHVNVIAHRHNSKESQAFSKEIESILEAVGWTVHQFLPATSFREVREPHVGLHESLASLPEFDKLKAGLDAMGLNFTSSPFSFDPKYQIGLDVGVVSANDYQALVDKVS